jgi:hypothetical protein
MLSRLQGIAAKKLIWILLLALTATFFRSIAVRDTQVDIPIRADAMDYYVTAYNITHNGVYSRSLGNLASPPMALIPDAYRPPGLSLIIAEFMNLWPQHDQIIKRVQFVNVGFGIATVILIFWCASLVLPLPGAIVVGALAAGSPHLVSLTVYILTETAAAFFVTLSLAITALALSDDARIKAASYLALGISIGILTLFRPAFLAFIPVMVLAFPNRSERWKALMFSCLGAGLIVGPWLIRNAISVPPGDSPSLLAGTLLEGSYRGYIYAENPSTFPYGGLHDPSFDFTRRSVFRTLYPIMNKIAADPMGMMMWYFFEKPIYLFQWNNIDGVGDIFVYPILRTPFRDNGIFAFVRSIFYYLHPFIITLGLVGCFPPWIRAAAKIIPQETVILLRMASLMVIYLYLIHLPFFNATRYAVPFFPVIFLLAVSMIVISWTWGRMLLQSMLGLRLTAPSQ